MISGMESVVRNHPFFEQMDDATLALIAGCGRNVRLKTGASLARLGSPSDVFYAIRSGRVSVEIHAPDRGALVIETLDAGEILGWSWLFPPYSWAFDARALEDVAAIEFDGKCLRQKCEADPALGYDLMKRFASLFAERLGSRASNSWTFMENLLQAEAPAGIDPHLPVAYRVVSARRETSDVSTLELQHPRRRRFRFSAGQFNMLYAFGVGEAPISISGDPELTATLLHTIRAVGPVTNALAAARRGDAIGVRGPFGSAWPVKAVEGGDLLIVAGGIGLAPLRPVLHHALNRRDRFGRVVLMYGARTPKDLLYARELERCRTRPDLGIETTVDRSAAGFWRGNVGPVTKLIPRASFDPSRAAAFVCGPEVMMRFTVQALLGRGIAPEKIYVSMERNMKCAVGLCGHCQIGPHFVCKEGPVFPWPVIAPFVATSEI